MEPSPSQDQAPQLESNQRQTERPLLDVHGQEQDQSSDDVDQNDVQGQVHDQAQDVEQAQVEGQDEDQNCEEDASRESFEQDQALRKAIKLAKLQKDGHILDNVLGSVRAKVSTRRQLANFSSHHAFISCIEPQKVHEALEDIDWVEAMHEELNNFERNKVWSLVEKPKE